MTDHYPNLGRASIIPCPTHGLAVALDEHGRISSSCPACRDEALTAAAILRASAGSFARSQGYPSSPPSEGSCTSSALPTRTA